MMLNRLLSLACGAILFAHAGSALATTVTLTSDSFFTSDISVQFGGTIGSAAIVNPDDPTSQTVGVPTSE